MTDDGSDSSGHHTTEWATIGGAFVGLGATVGVAIGIWGATSHLWAHDLFVLGFVVACLVTVLGIYVLLADVIGGIGPVSFPLPPTRKERIARRKARRAGTPPPTPEPSAADRALAERRRLAARNMVQGVVAKGPSKTTSKKAGEELSLLRDAGASLDGPAAAVLAEWVTDVRQWLEHRIDLAEEQRFKQAGAGAPPAVELAAKLDFLRDVLWPKIKDGYWAPSADGSPLEQWLSQRLDEAEGHRHERAVVGDRAYSTAMSAWDFQNVNDLLAKHPALVDSYRGEPPGHLPGDPNEDAYYDRQVRWIRDTLRRLRATGG